MVRVMFQSACVSNGPCYVSERLCEQWSVYDDNYESLMQWLRDLETNVKRVTELRATLKDKQLLADKYKVCDSLSVALLF